MFNIIQTFLKRATTKIWTNFDKQAKHKKKHWVHFMTSIRSPWQPTIRSPWQPPSRHGNHQICHGDHQASWRPSGVMTTSRSSSWVRTEREEPPDELSSRWNNFLHSDFLPTLEEQEVDIMHDIHNNILHILSVCVCACACACVWVFCYLAVARPSSSTIQPSCSSTTTIFLLVSRRWTASARHTRSNWQENTHTVIDTHSQ